MKKEELESLLNIMVSTGSDYSDIFLEDRTERTVKLLDSKIDNVTVERIKGAGLRVCDEHNTYYSAVNNLNFDALSLVVSELKKNLKKKRIVDDVVLNDLIDNSTKVLNKNLSDKEKKDYLLEINHIAGEYSNKITQVSAQFYEVEQDVIIATSEGKYIKDKRYLKRLIIIIFAETDGKKTKSVYSKGSSLDYSFLDEIDILDEVKKLCQNTIDKLSADYAPSGRMPVIIGSDSGVLIHEACGHALEATSVADDASILGNSLGKKIASDIVTIIDDGTIPNLFGSSDYDDEGIRTQKNILVEKGILKNFLVDKKNEKRMQINATGSARRESYYLSPTSRMNNTYLDKGTAKVEDMINSIEFGLYAKGLGGGEVNVVTGDFNFGVNEAFVIRNGKIAEMVVGASLIGNIKEVLNNIEAISDDLNYDTGICGSESGWVPVTCGQPTIKLSSILVGGKK